MNAKNVILIEAEPGMTAETVLEDLRLADEVRRDLNELAAGARAKPNAPLQPVTRNQLRAALDTKYGKYRGMYLDPEPTYC